MPGTAAGTAFLSTSSVRTAIASSVTGSVESVPGSTMFGLSSVPSSRTRCRASWS